MAAKKKVQPNSSEHRAKLAQEAIFKHTKLKPLGVDKGDKGVLPFVSSGSFVIDDLIGASCPGYPRKRITEVYGPESSGKTTAALHAITEVQKAGGVAMFLDFEHALHHGYAQKIGVKFDDRQLLYYAPENLEEGLKLIYIGIKAGVDLIVVDSVASMVPKAELEKKLDAAAAIGLQARIFSQNLPKVCIWLTSVVEANPQGTALVLINQTRATINSHGGDENTSGGKALKFFAYLRLRFSRIRSDFIKRKDKFSGKDRSYPFGNHTQVKVIKSKLDAKQGHSADIFIRFGSGIDDYLSAIETGANNKIVKKNGPMYTYGDQSFKGKDALRKHLIDNPKVFAELKKRVVEAIRAADAIPEAELEEGDEVISLEDAGIDSDDEATPEAVIEEVDMEEGAEAEA